MIVRPTELAGAVIVELDRKEDERGFFARTYDREEFAQAGLDPAVEQCSIAYNHHAGTVRGMHLQVQPAPEAKLVRVTRGGILDVIVDLREDSPTYLTSLSVELTADDRLALYVPPMCAHGYQTLTDAAEVFYQISCAYRPDAQRGLRYDDPALALTWPLPVSVISDRDRAWPLLEEGALTSNPTATAR